MLSVPSGRSRSTACFKAHVVPLLIAKDAAEFTTKRFHDEALSTPAAFRAKAAVMGTKRKASSMPSPWYRLWLELTSCKSHSCALHSCVFQPKVANIAKMVNMYLSVCCRIYLVFMDLSYSAAFFSLIIGT